MPVKSIFFRTLAVVLLILSCDQKKVELKHGYSFYVDSFISTASDHRQTDSVAVVPFGTAKPAPDTYSITHSGYDFDANEILGFSNTCFSGVGCPGARGILKIELGETPNKTWGILN